MSTVVTRIKTNSDNYSRYDSTLNTVQATLYVSSASPGDVLDVSLNRLDGYGSVLTVPVTVIGTPTVIRVNLPIESAVDPQYTHINRCRSGFYDVSCQGVNSQTFSISLVSVRRMRQEVLKGLPLLTSETIGPLQQPQIITGIFIDQVKPDIPGNVYTFTYTHSTTSLSFGDGIDTGNSVNIGSGGIFYLASQLDRFWVQISVDETLLPSSDTTELIMFDVQQFTDDMILAEIQHAQSEISDKVQAFLEPTQCCTQELGDWIHNPTHAISPTTNDFYDVVVPAVNYVRPSDWNNWYEMTLPQKRMIQIEALHGFLNQTDVVSLDNTWWTWNEMSGQVQLVPNQGAAVSWQYYTGFFYNFLMGSWEYVPHFWHWKATCGFRDLREKRANILQAVEYTAGINILRQAAIHAKPGYMSESLSRDGVQSNIQYQEGIYGATIKMYQDWLDRNLEKISTRHTGLKVYIF